MNLNDIMSASTLKGIGQKANATPDQVQSVLSTALPVLVQAMANNAKSGEGAQSLGAALSQHAAADVDKSLKNVDPADGVKILKHVLGEDAKTANKSIAKQSGISATTTAGILALAAPLLMNALGQEKEESKTSDSGLSTLLLSLLKGGGGASLLGALLGGGGSSSSSGKKDEEPDFLSSLLGAFSGKDDDDDDDDSILEQVGSLAAGLSGSGGKQDNGLAGLLMNMLKSK